jgi:hypothetical protein
MMSQSQETSRVGISTANVTIKRPRSRIRESAILRDNW